MQMCTLILVQRRALVVERRSSSASSSTTSSASIIASTRTRVSTRAVVWTSFSLSLVVRVGMTLASLFECLIAFFFYGAGLAGSMGPSRTSVRSTPHPRVPHRARDARSSAYTSGGRMGS